MAWMDYSRQWKTYQRQFMTYQRIRDRQQLSDVRSDIDIAQYKQLRTDLKGATQQLNSQQKQIGNLLDQEATLDATIYKTKNMNYQLVKAQIDADKYQYGEVNLKNGIAATALKKKIDSETDNANALTQKLFVLQQQRDQAAKNLADIYSQRDTDKGKIKKMTADFFALKTRSNNLSFSPLFYFRNAMLRFHGPYHPDPAGGFEKPAGRPLFRQDHEGGPLHELSFGHR